MEHTVTTKKWYVVTGTAGATVTSPDGSKTFCTVPEGGQGVFYATTPKVVTSDDSVEVIETTFNSAPVKMRLLGLLGGGVSTGLPVGYLAAEFLESTGTQYIKLSDTVDRNTGVEIVYQQTPKDNKVLGEFIGTRVSFSGNAYFWYVPRAKNVAGTSVEWNYYQASFTKTRNAYEQLNVQQNYFNSEKCIITNKNGNKQNVDLTGLADDANFPAFVVFGGSAQGKIWTINITQGDKIQNKLLPALDKDGVPCMYDKVSKQTYRNSGRGSFIVGMTLAQARKLGKLPAGGGSLTVSLPSNYAEDEGVVNALAKAQENGWVITIQTYEAEAGAASTFALRRIWVRKTQCEQGSYVYADGSRWQVEWCADVWGADPQELGYEPFRSVEAATEYWGLTPWVDPEQEELLTNIEEQ